MNAKYIPIIVEEVFDAPVSTVWQAITDVEEMKKWFFANTESFRPEVGFKTQFEVISQGRVFLHIWEVTEVEPEKSITVHWQYGGYSGNLSVTMGLWKVGNQTQFRVTCIGIETLPDSVPEFTRESCTAGWNYFIKDRLKSYLESK